MESYFLGDSSICWQLGTIIDKELNKQVLYLYTKLKDSTLKKELNIYDIVPSFNAIAVYFDAFSSDPYKIKSEIEQFFNNILESYNGSTLNDFSRVELPVIYNGEDLQRVAEINNLTKERVIELHCGAEYQVAMIGFKPHFPYLIGLDPSLETPRLDTPRTSIPPGSVAIGGAQTGIYPEKSPGGWNIIGTTDPANLISLKPGDIITIKRSLEL